MVGKELRVSLSLSLSLGSVLGFQIFFFFFFFCFSAAVSMKEDGHIYVSPYGCRVVFPLLSANSIFIMYIYDLSFNWSRHDVTVEERKEGIVGPCAYYGQVYQLEGKWKSINWIFFFSSTHTRQQLPLFPPLLFFAVAIQPYTSRQLPSYASIYVYITYMINYDTQIVITGCIYCSSLYSQPAPFCCPAQLSFLSFFFSFLPCSSPSFFTPSMRDI